MLLLASMVVACSAPQSPASQARPAPSHEPPPADLRGVVPELDCPPPTTRMTERQDREQIEWCEWPGGGMQGSWRALRGDGSTRLVGQYANGQRVGDWHELDHRGGVRTRYHYDRGALTDTIEYLTAERPIRSRVTFFRADGTPANERHYLDGLPHGQATHWDTQGEVTRVDLYRRGRLVQRRPNAEVLAIKGAFDNLVAALNGRGRASLYVDDDTMNRYEELRELALLAGEAEVRELSLTDQIIILRLRHEFEPSALGAASPAGFIDLGLLPPLLAPSPRDTITDVERIDQLHATAAIVRDGRQTADRISLVKTNGRWRVALFSLFTDADTHYRHLAQRRGLSESEFVRRMVQVASGRTVPSTIWTPPLRKPAGNLPP